jgi:hypothetical protein
MAQFAQFTDKNGEVSEDNLQKRLEKIHKIRSLLIQFGTIKDLTALQQIKLISSLETKRFSK